MSHVIKPAARCCHTWSPRPPDGRPYMGILSPSSFPNMVITLSLVISGWFATAEESVSCENPGLPDSGYQILSKRLYLPGESLTFVCYQGYELIGEVAIKCILGKPSFWSGPLPLCRGETKNQRGGGGVLFPLWPG